MSTPKATVLLPLFEAQHIAWLALESLCRQKTKHSWELIIAEEQRKNRLGEDGLEPFLEPLKKAGMVRVVYLPLTKRISLSEKWRMMSWLISQGSKVSLLQAADCYSEPKRIQTAVDAVAKGFDWIQSPKGVFYHIGTEQSMLYDASLIANKRRFKTHLNMAVRSDLIRYVPHAIMPRGIDGFVYNQCEVHKKKSENSPLRVFNDPSANWKKGVDTHGMNNISKKRGRKFETLRSPFKHTELKITDLLPQEIAEQLIALKNQLKTAA